MEPKDVIELYKVLIQSGNSSVAKFNFTGQKLLTDEVAKEIEQLSKNFNSSRDSSIISTGTPSKKSAEEKPKAPRKVAGLTIGFYQADFGVEGIDAIFRTCKQSDYVGELVLHGMYKPMEMQNIVTLKDILLSNNSDQNMCALTKLNIGGFAVTSQVSTEFFTVMNKQKRITHLTLFKWQLKASDIRNILIHRDLKDSSECVIEVLDVSNCDVGDEACKVLAEVLQSNRSLKTLILNNNLITETGVKALTDGLKESTVTMISKIELMDNDVNMESDSYKELMTLLLRDAGERQSMNRENSLRLQAVTNESFNRRRSSELELGSSIQDQNKLLEFL
jgi:hypothetical protein